MSPPTPPLGRASPPQSAATAFPRNRMIAVLSLFLFVNYLDRYSLSILLEPIKADLGLSDTQVGLLTGPAFALLYATLAIPVARVAERRDRTLLLAAAVIVWSAATALCGIATSFTLLFAARMMVGAGESGAVSPAQSMIGDAFSLERRGTALAIVSTGGALGTALAPMIGGYLEVEFGWRTAFLILGSLGLPVGLLLLFFTRDPARGLSDPGFAPGDAPPPFRIALRQLLLRPAFVLLIPGMVAIGIAEYSFFLWLPSYFSRTFGPTTASIGEWLTLYQGLPLLVGTMLGGIVSDRLVRRDQRWMAWLPMLACLVGAVTIAMIFATRDLNLALLLLVIPSTALGVYLAPSYSMIQALAGVGSRATAVALLTFVVNLLGLGLGPLIVGALSDLLQGSLADESLRYALLVVPPIYLLAALVFLVVSRYLVAGIEDAAAPSTSVAPVA